MVRRFLRGMWGPESPKDAHGGVWLTESPEFPAWPDTLPAGPIPEERLPKLLEVAGEVIELSQRQNKSAQDIIDRETRIRDYTDLGMSPPGETV